MSTPRISNPRVWRTGSPLALDTLRTVAPAVFATEPHSSRGPRYLYVPTVQPVQALLDNGWGVYEVAQQRSRKADKDPYTKHMLRMRKLEDFNTNSWKGEGVPEVVMINAHDGTAAYHMCAGFFRFICCNGMMVGQKLAGFKIRHSVGPQTSLEVLEASERIITERFPAMLDSMEAMRETRLEHEAQVEFAKLANRLRYGSTLPPFEATDLLSVRRKEDDGDSVWKVLNRIQENVMTGGWEARSHMFNRKTTVRPVERVSNVAKINGGLWDHAMELVGAE